MTEGTTQADRGGGPPWPPRPAAPPGRRGAPLGRAAALVPERVAAALLLVGDEPGLVATAAGGLAEHGWLTLSDRAIKLGWDGSRLVAAPLARALPAGAGPVNVPVVSPAVRAVVSCHHRDQAPPFGIRTGLDRFRTAILLGSWLGPAASGADGAEIVAAIASLPQAGLAVTEGSTPDLAALLNWWRGIAGGLPLAGPDRVC